MLNHTFCFLGLFEFNSFKKRPVRLADEAVTVAVVPLNFTSFSDAVVLRLVPLIITIAPIIPEVAVNEFIGASGFGPSFEEYESVSKLTKSVISSCLDFIVLVFTKLLVRPALGRVQW